MHTFYSRSTAAEEQWEALAAVRLENGLTKIGSREGNKATICVELVKEWIQFYSYVKVGAVGSGKVRIVGSGERVKCDAHYFQETFWQERLKSRVGCVVSANIPDDPIERLVFHFLEDWPNKLRQDFDSPETSIEDKVDLLSKQLENILFFGRERLRGSLWRMTSLPDDTLKQALLGEGHDVPVVDKHGKLMKTIQGRGISASVLGNISQEHADGPKPDSLDKMIYRAVLGDAVRKGEANTVDELSSWTLVTARFVDREGKSVICYAFSGDNDWKRSFPFEWWKKNKCKDKYVEVDRDVFFAKVNEKERLGQNMIMSIFQCLRLLYEEDLQKLGKLIAFENLTDSESLILNERKDCTTLDYGEYYDMAVKKCDERNMCIMDAVEKIVQKQPENLVSIKCCVTCGAKNQQFKPNEDSLDGLISNPARRQKVKKVAERQLQNLENDLKELPSQYLDHLSKQFRQGACGEDNILPLLLCKLLSRVDVFLSTRVELIAMDGKNLDGKPFCSRCDRKVGFFSILPSVLRHLGGATEEDNNLQKLFSELANETSGINKGQDYNGKEETEL